MEKQYKLDKNLYFETLWFIRRYPDLKAEYESLVYRSKFSDGQPKGNQTGDPTFETVNLLVKKSLEFAPIEKGLERIPSEYRKGILENIIERKPYPIIADTSTWKRWKRRFVFYVAMERLND